MTPLRHAAGRRAFADALLDPSQPCPPGLRAHNGSDPARRFAVHRNTVVGSLVDALAETFPVVQELVGDEFFAAMARLYVAEQPPLDAVLSRYGASFADFVESFEPAADVPYLADVARLEWLRVQAFHAADVEPLAPDAIGAQLADPRMLGGARLALHPSLGVLVSAYAVVSLWDAHQGRRRIADVDPRRAESALVLRDDDAALVVGIAPASAVFVRQLGHGATLAQAVAAAAAGASGFDLSGSLALLVRHRAIVAWHPPGDLR